MFFFINFSFLDKVSEFELKLLDIDSENHDIPDMEYESVVTMSASEFQRICSNLTSWGENLIIKTNKKKITFSVTGDIANGTVVIGKNPEKDHEVYLRIF